MYTALVCFIGSDLRLLCSNITLHILQASCQACRRLGRVFGVELQFLLQFALLLLQLLQPLA